jgi:hypothetical protein
LRQYFKLGKTHLFTSSFDHERSFMITLQQRRGLQKALAFIKAIPTLQLSPALLKELRMDLSSRKKGHWSLPGAAEPLPVAGSKPPNGHSARTRASAKQTG